MRRRNNQDNHAIHLASDEASWRKFGHLIIVADGMGAHAAGELASQLSVELIPHHYHKLFRGAHAEALQQSLVETNAEIFRRGQANPEFRSMGTTTCALTIVPEGALIGHVGDSRVYRLRGTQLEQLTFDHSLVWEMRATSDLSEEALRNSSIPKNVITRSLGPNASVAVDLEGPFPLRIGDKFLLCSDGLSGQLSDEELGIILQLVDIETAVQAMVDLANLRGGPDNITVVVCEVVSAEVIGTEESNAAVAAMAEGVFPIAFGVGTAIGLLLCVFMLLLGQFPFALIAFGTAIAAFATGWFKYRASILKQPASGSQFGRAPYRKAQCKPNLVFANDLASVVTELEAWFHENKWPIHSKTLSSVREQAKKADASRNFSESIKCYIQVMLQMMREARDNQHRESNEPEQDDDVIEY